ncbi:hypothetical protein SAMN05421788_11163 [Filimonas lacunae]|uniref:Uncharacterized protein n=1 Tax=Filimonas lacunae TaxID=477680 RepID=A0A173MB00_9BACT|nr:hypothetical protein [Filimonas lacunae]BAV04734.1 hypothetical protein FLA_0733 [Filimonas lacunae]SIT32237.1 hypothetical protein SAMN05421788_11163 [Filimonas lacunae]
MNEHLERVLKNSTNFDLWLAVSEYRVNDALAILSGESFIEKARRSWSRFWGGAMPHADFNSVREVAFKLLSNVPDTDLVVPKMILVGVDSVFTEWIRFCCSIHYSGHFQQQLEVLLKQTIQRLEELAEEVAQQSNGYPHNSINGGVWFNGATVRNWSDALGYLFELRNKPHNRATVLQCKCKITCSIMSHYPHLVGPDMIEAATALISIGDNKTAEKYYLAVIADFEQLLECRNDESNENIQEEELISFKALLDAYNGIDRIQAGHDYDDKRKVLEQLISNAGILSSGNSTDNIQLR